MKIRIGNQVLTCQPSDIPGTYLAACPCQRGTYDKRPRLSVVITQGEAPRAYCSACSSLCMLQVLGLAKKS